MDLIKPDVSGDVNVWGSELNQSLDSIDSHDHSPGKGVRLTPASLNINSDLDFGGHNAFDIVGVQYNNNQVQTGSCMTYVSGGYLFFNNASGFPIQLTSTTTLITSSSTRIKLPIVPAIQENSTLWNWSANFMGYQQTDVSSAALLSIEVALAQGITMREVRASFKGRSGALSAHTQVPTTPPSVGFWSQDPSTGNVTNLAFQGDTSASTGSYDAQHWVAITGLSIVTSKDLRCFIVVTGETGSGSLAARLGLFGVDVSWTQ